MNGACERDESMEMFILNTVIKKNNSEDKGETTFCGSQIPYSNIFGRLWSEIIKRVDVLPQGDLSVKSVNNPLKIRV